MLKALEYDHSPNFRLGETSSPVAIEDFDNWVGFQDRQLDAVKACYNGMRILYGGAAGGGKSYLLRWFGIRELIRMYAEYGIRGIRIGLFSESYPTLEERQINKVRMEVPSWLGKMNEQRHNLQLHRRYGGGVLCFRNLAHKDDYLSGEYAKVLFEEQTQCPEDKYDFVCTRIRWPGVPTWENIALGATNPGGIGHAYCKRRWVDGHLNAKEAKHTYRYIPARCSDNKYIPQGYVYNLMALPEKLAKAYAEGSWDIFEGQYFVEWDKDIHVVRPFQLPKQWIKFRCADYGFAKPAAMLWCAVNPWHQQVIVYRELYGPGMNPEQFAKKTLAMTPAGEDIAYTVLDPACWGDPKGDGSIADDMLMHGLSCLPGNNDRIDGAFRMRQYLEPFEYLQGGTPVKVARLVFFTNCVNCIRTIPSLIHDEHRVEDVDTDGEDHAYDGLKYGLMSRPSIDLTAEQQEVDAYKERKRLEFFNREFPERARRQARWR
ncbi:MAG: hypothetical protein ACYDCO_01825 [Armatimonadota bacterium]